MQRQTMTSNESWAPVFGWRVKDVAHIMLNRPKEELIWTDDEDYNLTLYPWWDELFEIVDSLPGVDIFDVPLFADMAGGPRSDTQIGCEAATFVGVQIRLDIESNARATYCEYVDERKVVSDEERKKLDYNYFADEYFSIDDGHIEQIITGFRNLKVFKDKYPDFPTMIAAHANDPEFYEDLDATYRLRMLFSFGSFDAHYLDKRQKQN